MISKQVAAKMIVTQASRINAMMNTARGVEGSCLNVASAANQMAKIVHDVENAMRCAGNVSAYMIFLANVRTPLDGVMAKKIPRMPASVVHVREKNAASIQQTWAAAPRSELG